MHTGPSAAMDLGSRLNELRIRQLSYPVVSLRFEEMSVTKLQGRARKRLVLANDISYTFAAAPGGFKLRLMDEQVSSHTNEDCQLSLPRSSPVRTSREKASAPRLPRPRLLPLYPEVRFDARHPP